jgi:Tol biopolymer transport system component
MQIGVLELATGESRYLTDPPAAGSVDYPALISPDGEFVAFISFEEDEEPGFQLSLVGLDGSPPRVLYKNLERAYVFPTGWSPDGKTILVVVLSEGTSAMTLISVDDGSRRVLKSLDWGGMPAPLFSPDGRWVAFNFAPDDDSPNRDIFILASDGSRQTTLIEHPADDYLFGWTPDGSAILFGSDRLGTPSWYAMGVADGNGRGDPVLVRPDMWGAEAGGLGFTEGGTFYYRVQSWRNEVYTATMDPETGALITPPVAVSGRHSGAVYNSPQWSPDGQSLAFVEDPNPVGSVPSGNLSIVIRPMATGESRTITPNLTYFNTPNWSHDGQSFLISGTDENGRDGFYRVDVHTGAVTTIVRDSRPASLQRAADGKTVFYVDPYGSEMGVFKHDLESGEVTGLYVAPAPDSGAPETGGFAEFAFQSMALSPNGRQLALVSNSADAVLVMDTNGGAPRELMRATATGDENQIGDTGKVTWSADGQHILFRKGNLGRSGDDELWRVPAEGGEAVLLGSGLPSMVSWAAHPDGRQIVYATRQRESEVWVMENFLPIDGLRTSSSRR